MATVREILGDEFATLQGQGKSNDEIIAIAKDRLKNPPAQQTTQNIPTATEHKPKTIFGGDTPDWYMGKSDSGVLNLAGDVLRGVGKTGLNYANVLQGGDKETTKLLQKLDHITEEHKDKNRTPERKAEVKELQKNYQAAETFGEKFEAGVDSMVDTVKNYKEWQMAEFFGENLDPVNAFAVGKGIVKGMTIGAMVNGVQGGAFAGARSDKTGLDAAVEGTLGATAGGVLGGITGHLTRGAGEPSYNKAKWYTGFGEERDAATNGSGQYTKDDYRRGDKVDEQGMITDPFNRDPRNVPSEFRSEEVRPSTPADPDFIRVPENPPAEYKDPINFTTPEGIERAPKNAPLQNSVDQEAPAQIGRKSFAKPPMVIENEIVQQKSYAGFADVINTEEASVINVDAVIKQIGQEMEAAGATPEMIEMRIADEMQPSPASLMITQILNDGAPVTPRLSGLNLQQAIMNSIDNPTKSAPDFFDSLIIHGLTKDHAAAATRAYEAGDISLYSGYAHDKLTSNIDQIVDVETIKAAAVEEVAEYRTSYKENLRLVDMPAGSKVWFFGDEAKVLAHNEDGTMQLEYNHPKAGLTETKAYLGDIDEVIERGDGAPAVVEEKVSQFDPKVFDQAAHDEIVAQVERAAEHRTTQRDSTPDKDYDRFARKHGQEYAEIYKQRFNEIRAEKDAAAKIKKDHAAAVSHNEFSLKTVQGNIDNFRYSKRSMGFEKARLEEADMYDDHAHAALAIVNLEKGEKVKLGDEILEVISVGKAQIKLGKDGKGKIYKVDSDKFSQLKRDVGGEILAEAHSTIPFKTNRFGSDIPEYTGWREAALRDPAAKIDENGVLAVSDEFATADLIVERDRLLAEKAELEAVDANKKIAESNQKDILDYESVVPEQPASKDYPAGGEGIGNTYDQYGAKIRAEKIRDNESGRTAEMLIDGQMQEVKILPKELQRSVGDQVGIVTRSGEVIEVHASDLNHLNRSNANKNIDKSYTKANLDELKSDREWLVQEAERARYDGDTERSMELHSKRIDLNIREMEIEGKIDNSYRLAHEALPVEEVRTTTQQSALFGDEQQLFDIPSETTLKTPKWAKALVSDTVRYEDIVREVTDAKNDITRVTPLAKRAMQAIALDELERLVQHPRYKEVLDFTRELTAADGKSPQRLESGKKVSTVDNVDGLKTTVEMPTYSKNYAHDFMLTKARVKRIESGKPTLQDIETLKADLDMMDNNPDYAPTKSYDESLYVGKDADGNDIKKSYADMIAELDEEATLLKKLGECVE